MRPCDLIAVEMGPRMERRTGDLDSSGAWCFGTVQYSARRVHHSTVLVLCPFIHQAPRNLLSGADSDRLNLSE